MIIHCSWITLATGSIQLPFLWSIFGGNESWNLQEKHAYCPPPIPSFMWVENTIQNKGHALEKNWENVGMVSISSFPSHTQHYKRLLFYMNINRRMKRIPHLSIFSTGITCVKMLMVKQLLSDFNQPNGSEERLSSGL